MLNKNKIGLVAGSFLAVIHAIWVLTIAIMPNVLQNFLDWVFQLHFLKPLYVITPFNLKDAIFLVVLTFVVGFIFGWIFTGLYNLLSKKIK